MKTILLTGASGFIGAHVAGRLLSAGFKIIAPVREQSHEKVAHLAQQKNFSVLTGAFYDPAFLLQLKEKIDVILHFASIRGEGSGDAKTYQDCTCGHHNGQQQMIEADMMLSEITGNSS